MPKRLSFWHFGTVKTCLIMPARKFWDASAETAACRRNDPLFFAV